MFTPIYFNSLYITSKQDDEIHRHSEVFLGHAFQLNQLLHFLDMSQYHSISIFSMISIENHHFFMGKVTIFLLASACWGPRVHVSTSRLCQWQDSGCCQHPWGCRILKEEVKKTQFLLDIPGIPELNGGLQLGKSTRTKWRFTAKSTRNAGFFPFTNDF